MVQITRLDWEIIQSRAKGAVDAHRLPTSSVGLLWLVLDQFFPSLQDDRIEVITDGPDDQGVDALHIVESEHVARVFIFQSKCRERYDLRDRTINSDETLKVCQFLSNLFNKSEILRLCGNLRLREGVQRVWELHERGILCRYHVVFCSNDAGVAASARDILDGFCKEHEQISHEWFGPRQLVRALTSGVREPESGHLQVIGKEVFERADGDVRGLIASIDANSFIDLIKTPDGKGVKRHIFDDNLRIFLGSNAGYNGEIIQTAISDEAYLFWYLNNGITITCKTFSYNKGHSNPKIYVEDFQIVNGAQTSHSLVEATLRNPECLEDVVLMVRVYATERADIAERVAVATNSQARIQGRDLRANTEVMKKLEAALLHHGIYFERKRNLHADRDPSVRIDALKLGQIILSFYLCEPDKAKTESDSIFDSKFRHVFTEGMDIPELVKLIKLYSKIEWLRDDFASRVAPHFEDSGDYQYLLSGHWFVLYACRLLLMRGSNSIPENEEAGKLIEDAIGVVARACAQSKAVAHYQMFRSPRTREKIIAEVSGRQIDLFERLMLGS